MPLKPYRELVAIDVRPYCDTRKVKDDNGKQVDIPYLNWAKCIELLYANGAENVYFEPVKNAAGSYVHSHYETQNKDGRKTGCYFVEVEVHIDDKAFNMAYPLMNGALVVYDDTMNQLRIDNAHKRAFVKAVAIRTGLGFDLWSGESEVDKSPDDLSVHSALAIKDRIERKITTILTRRKCNIDDVCAELGTPEKPVAQKQLTAALNNLSSVYVLEAKLDKLL